MDATIPPLCFFDKHNGQSLQLSLGFAAPTPTTFHKVEIGLGDSRFSELPSNPKLIGTAPYHAYGQMDQTTFPGWKQLARILSVSTFCSSAIVEATNNIPRLAIKGVLFLKTDILQQQSAERMRKEATFYSEHLQELQGRLVPKHYGLWHASDSQWGGEVLIAVMEWGGMPLDDFLEHASNTLPIRIRVAEALDELHDHGIYHGHIGKGRERHILYIPETGSVCFVDFSDAHTGHICGRLLPVRLFSSHPISMKFGCPEAYSARNCLRLFGTRHNKDDKEMKIALVHMQDFLQQGMSQRDALLRLGQIIDHWRTVPELQGKRKPVFDSSQLS